MSSNPNPETDVDAELAGIAAGRYVAARCARIALGLWAETYDLALGIATPNHVEARDGRIERAVMNPAVAEGWMGQLMDALHLAARDSERAASELGWGTQQTVHFQRLQAAGPEPTGTGSLVRMRTDWLHALHALHPRAADTAVIGHVAPSFLALMRCFNLPGMSDLTDGEMPEAIRRRVSPHVLHALKDTGSASRRYFEFGRLSARPATAKAVVDIQDRRRVHAVLSAIGDGLVAPLVRAAIQEQSVQLQHDPSDHSARLIAALLSPQHPATPSGAGPLFDRLGSIDDVIAYGPDASFGEVAGPSRAGVIAAERLVGHEFAKMSHHVVPGISAPAAATPALPALN